MNRAHLKIFLFYSISPFLFSCGNSQKSSSPKPPNKEKFQKEKEKQENFPKKEEENHFRYDINLTFPSSLKKTEFISPFLFILLENGDFYYYHTQKEETIKVPISHVKDFSGNHFTIALVDESYQLYNSSLNNIAFNPIKNDTNIKVDKIENHILHTEENSFYLLAGNNIKNIENKGLFKELNNEINQKNPEFYQYSNTSFWGCYIKENKLTCHGSNFHAYSFDNIFFTNTPLLGEVQQLEIAGDHGCSLSYDEKKSKNYVSCWGGNALHSGTKQYEFDQKIIHLTSSPSGESCILQKDFSIYCLNTNRFMWDEEENSIWKEVTQFKEPVKKILTFLKNNNSVICAQKEKEIICNTISL